MSTPLTVQLRRLEGAVFEALHPSGERIRLEGPPDLGGGNQYFRPMENVLIALAGCAAVDILHIAQKARKTVSHLDVDVSGTRADAVPAVFDRIELTFRASGDFAPAFLERAANLSMEKYCSVARMLAPTVQISHRIALLGTTPSPPDV
jgi:putative redox protein